MTAGALERSDVAARVRGYLAQHVLLARDAPITDDTPLLRGRVDSMGLVELLTFLEDEFDIELAGADIHEENFGTIAAIADLVIHKRAGPA